MRRELEEAEETLSAITRGRVDALVVEHPSQEHQVLLLGGARLDDRLLIDRLPQGAVLLSRAGDVLHANPAFAALLGTAGDELTGRSYRELVMLPDQHTVRSMLDGALDDAAAAISLAVADGSSLPMQVIGVPLADRAGVCLIVTHHDRHADDDHATVRAIRRGEIDAVVVAEDRDEPQVLLLGAAGRRYRHLVDHMPDGAVTLSDRGDVIYANPRAGALLGLTPAALIGRRFADFLDPSDYPLLDVMLDGRRGPGWQCEVSLRRKDGAAVPTMVTPVPAADEHGISLLLSDLTHRRRLDEAEQTLQAIGSGEVDAFVVARGQNDEVEMLTGAHRPYRIMVERMQQGAVTLSSMGEILYANQPFTAMLGRPLGGLIGTPLADLVTPADRPLLAALIDAQHGSGSQSELTLLHANGAYVPALVAVALLPDEGGVCLIVTDLTAQKAYEAIVAAQTLERSILDQAIDAIVLCNCEGRVSRASRAAFELCNTNPLLAHFRDVFTLESADGPPDICAVMRGATTIRGAEYTLRCAGAPQATVLLSAGPVVDGDGVARGCVITMTDITDRRRAEDRLRESDRHKDEFLAILAHELRNPLAPIRSAVELLRVSELTEQPRAMRAIDIIARQTSNLIRLVDDLLDINRINQGKIVLQLAVLDLRTAVDQAIEICRPVLASRKHRFAAQLPAEAVPVRGDAVRLAQVVVNLLTNAANYTPPGGDIELRIERERGERPQAAVHVTDNGVGIPTDMLARIFEPYQQATQARERYTGGLGLGLTVSRRLMQMHDGTVEAFSDGPGRGSRFVARLPIAAELAEPTTTMDTAPEGASALRVLVVDDNRDAAETLAQLMQLGGHDVRMHTNGAAAIASAAESLPDVVLLDIGMPGMDGYEVARRLRHLPGGRKIRVIAMTGYGSAEDRQRSIESGIDHHLVKPVDFNALQSLLTTDS